MLLCCHVARIAWCVSRRRRSHEHTLRTAALRRHLGSARPGHRQRTRLARRVHACLVRRGSTPPERPGARTGAASRGSHWGWTRTAGRGRVGPQGGDANGAARGKLLGGTGDTVVEFGAVGEGWPSRGACDAPVHGSLQMLRNSMVSRRAPTGRCRPISHGSEGGEHAS